MIDPFLIRELVAQALREDLLYGDATTNALFQKSFPARAEVVAKEPLVVAGVDVFQAVFSMLDPSVRLEALAAPGTSLEAGSILVRLEGDGRSILKGERTALNFLQRLCGIATLSRKFVAEVAGTQAKIVDTRKTTPGYRALEKAAVRLGGGSSHRAHLGDLILIKDNHIALVGGIRAAIQAARAACPHPMKIELEVDRLDDLEAAMAGGVEIIMLDNMALSEIKKAVSLIRAKAPSVLIEVSGRVNLKSARAIAECGVDLISVGALTHSARAVDIGLDIQASGAWDAA